MDADIPNDVGSEFSHVADAMVVDDDSRGKIGDNYAMRMTASSNLFNITIDNDADPEILDESSLPTRSNDGLGQSKSKKDNCFLSDVLKKLSFI